jgi:threonylcarbamoyladenosine tRNA methylthiotransferase MtaB
MRREGTMRIYVGSLGCKLNQSEMDALATQLARAGHHLVTAPAGADLCVLNTCAVTHVAAQKSRQALRRLHREAPTARLLITGCYAELAPADLHDLPGVERVIGNQDKEKLGDLIAREPAMVGASGSVVRTRTRALVKIQDGCDNACAYCIIHVARGPQRSRSPDKVLDDVKSRLADGYQEIVLTGVHIGAYGHDAGSREPDLDLWDLVGRILADSNVPRLRLSSIEPWDLPEQAFRLWEDSRLCRHLHLPLQSGSDATLQRMARHYATAEFAALVEAARAAIPGLAVTTDVIVGFPGESEREFAESLSTVEALQFARVHVFPFSSRPGTPAAQMRDQVQPQVKARRSRDMRAVAAAGHRDFRQRFVGQTMDVLWESSRLGHDGVLWSGLTDNYLRVHAASAADLANTLTPTRLDSLTGGGLRGRIQE